MVSSRRTAAAGSSTRTRGRFVNAIDWDRGCLAPRREPYDARAYRREESARSTYRALDRDCGWTRESGDRVAHSRAECSGPRNRSVRGMTLIAFLRDLIFSLNEASPNSMLEARCCGATVVATDVGSVSESVVDRETGILIHPPRRCRRDGRRSRSVAEQSHAAETDGRCGSSARD